MTLIDRCTVRNLSIMQQHLQLEMHALSKMCFFFFLYGATDGLLVNKVTLCRWISIYSTWRNKAFFFMRIDISINNLTRKVLITTVVVSIFCSYSLVIGFFLNLSTSNYLSNFVCCIHRLEYLQVGNWHLNEFHLAICFLCWNDLNMWAHKQKLSWCSLENVLHNRQMRRK